MRHLTPLLATLLVTLIALSGCAEGRPTEGILVRSITEIVPPPPPPPPSPATVRLLVVGDIMLARRPGEVVAKGVDPFADFAGLLSQSDVALGNLECVVATVGKQVPKAYNFRCHPRIVPLLARYFHAVSVANNHSGDFGKEAFVEELGLLANGGMGFFGGGKNLAEAHTPLLVERSGLRIAVLAYNDVELRSYEAGEATPGLAWAVDELAVASVIAARSKHNADLVVVYPHWGLEYQSLPSERQRSLARKLVDAGADLVVGAHPHVTQTVEYYKDRLIVYSLGNFVFDDFLDVPADLSEPSRTSWVLRVTLGKAGLVKWDTVVARTDDQGIPRLVPKAVSPCGKAVSKEIATCVGN